MIKARRVIVWIALPLLAGLIGFVVWSSPFQRAWRLISGRTPLLECPRRLDLGERMVGEIVHHRFSIRNRGTRPLLIDQVSSSCACSGLERIDEGQAERIESLRIEAGGSAEMQIRVAAQGSAGTGQDSRITFRTNDPENVTAWIDIHIPNIKALATVVPSTVAYGRLQLRDDARQRLVVYDNQESSAAIQEVRVTRPDQFSVQVLPARDQPNPSGTSSGRAIGVVELIAKTDRTGTLESELEIFVSGWPLLPCRVQITGEVVGPIELQPRVLVLPRASKSGSTYSATCLCRSTGGQRFSLSVTSLPSDVQVEIMPPSPATRTVYEVRVTWFPSGELLNSSIAHHTLRLTAALDNGESAPLDLELYCRSSTEHSDP